MSRSLQQNWKLFSTHIQTFWMSQWLVSLTMRLESFLKLSLSERETSQRKRSLILLLTRFRRIKSLEEVWSLLNRFPRQPVEKFWNESWGNNLNIVIQITQSGLLTLYCGVSMWSESAMWISSHSWSWASEVLTLLAMSDTTDQIMLQSYFMLNIWHVL